MYFYISESTPLQLRISLHASQTCSMLSRKELNFHSKACFVLSFQQYTLRLGHIFCTTIKYFVYLLTTQEHIHFDIIIQNNLSRSIKQHSVEVYQSHKLW